jgi:Tol biopolymer transport system component
VPSLGGDPFLVAADSQCPRFSPDSQKIAYLQGGKLYVSSVSMGSPVELLGESGLRIGSPPLWAPDGKHLLVAGSLDGGAEEWWAVPAEGGPPQSMHAAGQFSKVGLVLLPSEGWDWSGSHIVTYHDTDMDLYRVPVDLASLQVTAPPERLTFGSGIEYAPAGSTDGKIAFTDVRQDRNIAGLKLDPQTGAAIGELEELTSAESSETAPDIVHDRLVYMSNRWGTRDIWTKDLASGKEANLTNDTAEQWQPVLSADGERVAYLIYEEGRQAIYARPFTGEVGRSLCADCGQPRSWSPDGRFLLYERGEPDAIHALELETGKQTKILSMEGSAVDEARFSPDGEWLVFRAPGGEAGLFVARFHQDQPVSRPEWIEAVGDKSAALPTWGGDGNTVYFTSGRLGSPDIWMQRLEPVTKHPRGEPQLIRRFPFMRHSIAAMAPNQQRLAATRERLVFPLSELGGSVWLMEPRPQQPSR